MRVKGEMMETTSKRYSISTAASRGNSNTTVMAQGAWIVLFAALTAVGAQVQIPHQPVPFTLQTFFVLLGAAFLGSRNASLSQLLYLGVGLIGAPVFTAGGFGAARLFGPTGGYLLSFPIAALLIGYLVRLREGFGWTLIAMFLGLVVVFTLGTSFLNLFYLHNFKQAFEAGFLIFSWWDVLKLSAAAAIYNEFAKRYKRLPQKEGQA
jgi:biotin transport system substrate-specific component